MKIRQSILVAIASALLVTGAGAAPAASDSEPKGRFESPPIMQTDDFPVGDVDLSRTLSAGEDPILLEMPLPFNVETNFLSHEGYSRHARFKETGRWMNRTNDIER